MKHRSRPRRATALSPLLALILLHHLGVREERAARKGQQQAGNVVRIDLDRLKQQETEHRGEDVLALPISATDVRRPVITTTEALISTHPTTAFVIGELTVMLLNWEYCTRRTSER